MNIGERITTSDQPEYTSIIIYPYIEKWKLILLALWVAGFTFVGAYMFYILFGGVYSLEVVSDNIEDTRDQQLVYTIVFLGFWFYFEYKTLRALLWYKFGREFVRLDSDALTHKRSIFNYGKAHRYFYENIKKMRQFENDNTTFGQFFENAIWSLGTDGIIFEYFKKEKTFGRRLSEKDGKLLLRFIEDKVKTLRKKK